MTTLEWIDTYLLIGFVLYYLAATAKLGNSWWDFAGIIFWPVSLIAGIITGVKEAENRKSK